VTKGRALPLLLALSLAPGALGCEIVEANVRAIDVLASESSTDEQRGYAYAVIGGTLAVVAGLGVAATIAGASAGDDGDSPSEYVVVDELAWGIRRDGDETRWRRCTSRLLCTHQQIVEESRAVLAITPAGRGRPTELGGGVGEEVDLFVLRVRRRRE
jgi:hypothetical protein